MTKLNHLKQSAKASALAVAFIAGAALLTSAAADLKNCKPVKNCRSADKPCFVSIPQDDFALALIGENVENNPLRSKAAIRLRMCTGVDDVCQSGSDSQRLNWTVVNQVTDEIVTGGQLSTDSGILDTGPYTEIGPHTFIGVNCLFGDEPCKIAWQYCELELPFLASSPQIQGKGYKKPGDIAPHLRTRDGTHVKTHSLMEGLGTPSASGAFQAK